MARSKKKKPRKDEFKPVSLSFLEMAWSRRPLPAPPDLAPLVSDFNAWAEAHIDDPPSRSQIEERLGSWVDGWLSEANLSRWTEWLLENCTSQAQEKRIVRTMTEFVSDPLAEENPVMEFLLQAWMRELPPELARWASLWSSARLARCQPEPELPPEYFERMLAEAGPMEPVEFELERWELFYPWLRRWGRAAGWACGPDEFYEELTRSAFEAWLQHEAAAVTVPESLTAPQRKLYLWYYLGAVSHRLRGRLSDWGWHCFVFDSNENEWVIDLADTLAEERRWVVAEAWLKQALCGRVSDFDLYLSLAEISAASGQSHQLVAQHLQAAERICAEDQHYALRREDVEEMRQLLGLEQPA